MLRDSLRLPSLIDRDLLGKHFLNNSAGVPAALLPAATRRLPTTFPELVLGRRFALADGAAIVTFSYPISCSSVGSAR